MKRVSRAVVFDLDGTLIDSAPEIHAAVNRVMDRHGLAPFTPEETRRFIGNGVPHLIACCLDARGRDGDTALHERMIAELIESYETAMDLTALYPGVVAALEALARDGVPLALCTNKPAAPARAVLAHLGLAAHFPVVIGGDSLGTRKPDPAPLCAAFEGLGAPGGLFVGDSEIDAETAARAEVPFVLYTEGYRKGPVADMAHDRRFADFADLPAIVAEMLGPDGA